jgi:hypothetical protein
MMPAWELHARNASNEATGVAIQKALARNTARNQKADTYAQKFPKNRLYTNYLRDLPGQNQDGIRLVLACVALAKSMLVWALLVLGYIVAIFALILKPTTIDRREFRTLGPPPLPLEHRPTIQPNAPAN